MAHSPLQTISEGRTSPREQVTGRGRPTLLVTNSAQGTLEPTVAVLAKAELFFGLDEFIAIRDGSWVAHKLPKRCLHSFLGLTK